MASSILEQAADVTPGTKSYMRATVTVAERIKIPTDMQSVYCVFQAYNEEVFIRFGGSGVVVDCGATGVAGLTSEVLTEDVTSPHLHVPVDSSRSVRLPVGLFTYFSHVSPTGAAGYLIFGGQTGTGTQNDK